MNSPEARDLQRLSGDIKVSVPAFESLEGKIIEKHLDQYAKKIGENSDIPEWRDLFTKFQTSFNS